MKLLNVLKYYTKCLFYKLSDFFLKPDLRTRLIRAFTNPSPFKQKETCFTEVEIGYEYTDEEFNDYENYIRHENVKNYTIS